MANNSDDPSSVPMQDHCPHISQYIADRLYDGLAASVIKSAEASGIDPGNLMLDIWRIITRDQFNWPALRRPCDISYEAEHMFADHLKSSPQFRDAPL